MYSAPINSTTKRNLIKANSSLRNLDQSLRILDVHLLRLRLVGSSKILSAVGAAGVDGYGSHQKVDLPTTSPPSGHHSPSASPTSSSDP